MIFDSGTFAGFKAKGYILGLHAFAVESCNNALAIERGLWQNDVCI